MYTSIYILLCHVLYCTVPPLLRDRRAFYFAKRLGLTASSSLVRNTGEVVRLFSYPKYMGSVMRSMVRLPPLRQTNASPVQAYAIPKSIPAMCPKSVPVSDSNWSALFIQSVPLSRRRWLVVWEE